MLIGYITCLAIYYFRVYQEYLSDTSILKAVSDIDLYWFYVAFFACGILCLCHVLLLYVCANSFMSTFRFVRSRMRKTHTFLI